MTVTCGRGRWGCGGREKTPQAGTCVWKTRTWSKKKKVDDGQRRDSQARECVIERNERCVEVWEACKIFHYYGKSTLGTWRWVPASSRRTSMLPNPMRRRYYGAVVQAERRPCKKQSGCEWRWRKKERARRLRAISLVRSEGSAWGSKCLVSDDQVTQDKPLCQPPH